MMGIYILVCCIVQIDQNQESNRHKEEKRWFLDNCMKEGLGLFVLDRFEEREEEGSVYHSACGQKGNTCPLLQLYAFSQGLFL